MENKYASYKANARYQFCEIPNTDEGKDFVRLLKKYLNKDAYKATVKGHLLDSEKYNWRKFQFGTPIYAAKALRVYINVKAPLIKEKANTDLEKLLQGLLHEMNCENYNLKVQLKKKGNRYD